MWARDDTAEELVRVIRELSPVVREPMTRDELMQRIGAALDAAHTALRNLERVGARTLPQ